MAFWINIYGCQPHPRQDPLSVKHLKNDSYRQALYRTIRPIYSGTHRRGFQFLLILDLWGISFHAVVVFGLGKNLLFKSILGHSVVPHHTCMTIHRKIVNFRLWLHLTCLQTQLRKNLHTEKSVKSLTLTPIHSRYIGLRNYSHMLCLISFTVQLQPSIVDIPL